MAHRFEEGRAKFKDGPRDKRGQAYLKLPREDAEGEASPSPTPVTSERRELVEPEPEPEPVTEFRPAEGHAE